MKIFSILFLCMVWGGQKALYCGKLSDILVIEREDEQWKTVFKAAKKRVQNLIDHLEDHCDHLSNGVYKINVKDCLFHGKPFSMKDAFKINRGILEKLLEALGKTEKGTVPLQNTLKEFLRGRLASLRVRKQSIEILKENEELYVCGKTNPILYEQLSEVGKWQADLATDVYQTRNQIIISLCSLVSVGKFREDVKFLIAASPALWPKIQGIEEDLGHPDQVILDDEGEILKEGDVSLYERYVYPSKWIKLSRYASFYKSKNKYLFSVSLFEHQEMTGVVSGQKKIPPLEIPDFLKTPSQALVTTPGASGGSGPGIKSKNLSVKKSRKEIVTPPFRPEIDVPQAVSQGEREPEPAEPIQKPISLGLNPVSQTKIAVVKLVSSKPEAFKSEQSASSQQRQLRGRNLKTHQAVFDANPQNVNFRAFKTLWTYLGGEILSNRGGGSHRVLKWNGQTIGGTHVPHGGNNYGPRSIRSLREALSAIGVGQNVEEVFFQKG